MKKHIFLLVTLLFVGLLGLSAFAPLPQTDVDAEEWQKDWGVPEGFSIEIDTAGYKLPTSIAFVPNPGRGPNAPLYFVAELRGKLKVVTNDRSVHVFAENFFEIQRNRNVTNPTDEFGLTGVCLAPEQGYVFVTYTYQENGELYNNITRFKSKPNIFGLTPDSLIEIGEVFADFPTGASHQIGNCAVDNEMLYVGVGDGFSKHQRPVDIDIPAGKILRFTLDGEPVRDNPFFNPGDLSDPASYVYAYGFRNPYGLAVINREVYTASNGIGIDRFVHVEIGEDYLWDGNDRSIGAKANVTFSPTVAPTQMTYYSFGNDSLPTEYNDTFFIGMSGRTKGILRLPFSVKQDDVIGVPEDFLTYLGDTSTFYSGIVAGVAMGADGLYFSSLFPNRAKSAAVYKITYDPSNEHPFRNQDILTGDLLIQSKGCLGCHSLNSAVGGVGPSLSRDTLVPALNAKLHSKEYKDQSFAVDKLITEPYLSTTKWRKRIRNNDGYSKILLWTAFHIVEPKFDNPDAQMPNLGLSEEQGQVLAAYLIGEEDQTLLSVVLDNAEGRDNEEASAWSTFRDKLPPIGYRHVPLFLLAGGLIGGGVMWLFYKRKIRE
ncbi:MAG: PQQ-dependent sugar dehydrogenase [Chloroflexota bacterium]